MGFDQKYYSEKLWTAVERLAATDASIHDRMRIAWWDALSRLAPQEDPPPGSGDDFETWRLVDEVIERLIVHVPEGNGGSFEATLAKLAEADLEEIARKIVLALATVTRLPAES